MRDLRGSVLASACALAFMFGMQANAQYPVQPGGIFCSSDLNRDLVVDAADLGLLLSAWGGCG